VTFFENKSSPYNLIALSESVVDEKREVFGRSLVGVDELLEVGVGRPLQEDAVAEGELHEAVDQRLELDQPLHVGDGEGAVRGQRTLRLLHNFRAALLQVGAEAGGHRLWALGHLVQGVEHAAQAVHVAYFDHRRHSRAAHLIEI